jgi:hypothetical protein
MSACLETPSSLEQAVSRLAGVKNVAIRPSGSDRQMELHVKVSRAIDEMQFLKPNWDGEKGDPPTIETITAARRLAFEIIDTARPQMLHVAAVGTGDIQLSLYGEDNQRELDLSVGEESAGQFRFLACIGKTFDEGSLPIGRFKALMPWLHGTGKLP